MHYWISVFRMRLSIPTMCDKTIIGRYLKHNTDFDWLTCSLAHSVKERKLTRKEVSSCDWVCFLRDKIWVLLWFVSHLITMVNVYTSSTDKKMYSIFGCDFWCSLCTVFCSHCTSRYHSNQFSTFTEYNCCKHKYIMIPALSKQKISDEFPEIMKSESIQRMRIYY